MFPFWWELPLTFFGLSLVVFCLFVFGSLRLFETCLTFKDFGERCPPQKVFQKGKVPFLWKFKGDFPLLETFFFRGTFPSEGGKVSKDFSPFGFTRVTRVIALFRHFSIGAFSASWLSFWGHYFFFHFDLGVSNTTWTALCVLFVSVFVCLFSVLVHKKSGDSAATPAECLYYWFWVV